jgi:glutamate-1-semialdehyde 2,1-aminomutase
MARLTKSERLYRRARRVTPGGVNSPVRYYPPYPMFVASAKGSKFRTADGKEFLDYCMAYGALIDGHTNAQVAEAVEEVMKKGWIYGQPTETEVELSETITSLVPSMQMVRLVNSGTEATMHAVRLARGFSGRKKILKFEGGFHGSHDSVLAKGGRRGSVAGVPSSAGVPFETSKNTLVAPYNNERMATKIIRDQANELAAVLVEPVAGNIGPIPPAKGFLKALRKVSREADVLLIFDEVITGFRLSLGGAQEYYNVKPDLTILGKIVGGGFPLAAFGGKRDVMEKVAPIGPVYQAGTYAGNPVSAAAGLASLRSLKRRSNRIYPTLENRGKSLATGISEEIEAAHISAQVNQIGSMFQIFFTDRQVTDYASARSSDSAAYGRYFRSLLRSQVFVPPSQLESCFLSTAHTDDDTEETLNAIGNGLESVGG